MNYQEELCNLYDKNQDIVGKMEYITIKGKKGEILQIPLVLLPVFHSTVSAQITIDIDNDGNFLGAEQVHENDKTTIIPITETSGCRTSGVEPHPLCDNLKYLSEEYDQYIENNKKSYIKNHCLYMEGLRNWHLSQYTHKKVDAIYQYLKKETVIRDLVDSGILILNEKGKLSEKNKIQNISQTDAFVRFRIIEKLDSQKNFPGNPDEKNYSECWLDRSLHNSYIDYYRSILKEKDICYLTGKEEAISYLQPKKIRNEGDGAKLISSNDEQNFTFLGRFTNKKEAFAIGFETSQKMHNALKWIIRKQGYNWNNLCVVVWESDLRRLPEWNLDTESICDEYEGWISDDDETEKKYGGTGEVTASRFNKAMRGYGKRKDYDSSVVLLAFDSATTGRLAMIEHKVFESNQYIQNIQYWHESCKWKQIKYKDKQKYSYMGMAGIKDIADALYGTEQSGILSIGGKSRMYAEACKRFLPCISQRRKIPDDLVALIVRKASSPVSYTKRENWEKVLGIACSFVKKQRLEKKQEEWNMEVNTLATERDYLYGRLLAVADRIEYRTFDKEKEGKRVTNARRYMNAFSQHPYQTWKILEEQIQPYLQKLNLSERNTYHKLLDEIYHLFKPEDFINNERLDGLYLLGFHSQSYDFKYDKEKVKEEQQQ